MQGTPETMFALFFCILALVNELCCKKIVVIGVSFKTGVTKRVFREFPFFAGFISPATVLKSFFGHNCLLDPPAREVQV